MKIRLNKIDVLFSKFIRSRDGMCVWCGRSDVALECSHIFSRRHAATRWDPENAKALCFTCHRKWHENPVEAAEWIRGYLGDTKLEEVRQRARSIVKLTKRDKDDIYNGLKTLLG